MKQTKSLIDTNPYLKDPAERKKLADRSAISSCGVEGIKVNTARKSVVIPKKSKR